MSIEAELFVLARARELAQLHGIRLLVREQRVKCGPTRKSAWSRYTVRWQSDDDSGFLFSVDDWAEYLSIVKQVIQIFQEGRRDRSSIPADSKLAGKDAAA